MRRILILAVCAVMLASCSGGLNGQPDAGQAIKLGNDQARHTAIALQAAQTAFHAANGHYAASLAELYNGGHAPSYIDADLADGVADAVAVRLLTSGDMYEVTVVPGRDAIPVPGAALAPDADFRSSAPSKDYAVDDTGLQTDDLDKISAATARIVNAQAKAVLAKVQVAQAAYLTAQGQVSDKLNVLFAAGSDNPYADAQLASGQVGYVHVLLSKTGDATYLADAAAASGTGVYRVYSSAEDLTVTENTIDGKARELAQAIVSAEQANKAAHGRITWSLYELPDPGVNRLDVAKPLNVWFDYIPIDDQSFYVLSGGGKAPDLTLEFHAPQPYQTYWTDVNGVQEASPEQLNTLVIDATNLKASTAIQTVATAQELYYAANHSYASSASDLNVPPAPQLPYVDPYIASGAIGNQVYISTTGQGQTYSAWASAGSAMLPYHLYRLGADGKIVVTDVDTEVRSTMTQAIAAEATFRTKHGRYALYLDELLYDKLLDEPLYSGYVQLIGTDAEHYLLIGAGTLNYQNAKSFFAAAPYRTYVADQQGQMPTAPTDLDTRGRQAVLAQATTLLQSIAASQASYHSAHGSYAANLNVLAQSPQGQSYLDPGGAFNGAIPFLQFQMSSTGQAFTALVRVNIFKDAERDFTIDQTGTIQQTK